MDSLRYRQAAAEIGIKLCFSILNIYQFLRLSSVEDLYD